MQQSQGRYRIPQALSELNDIIWRAVESGETNNYEPTGIQEDVITAFGCGKYEIVLCLHPNDVGKTTAGAQILKNLIWPHDPKWFSWWQGYSMFRDKTFPLKKFRITGTHTNLAETGPMQTEITRWWPQEHYSWTKAGQHFPSKCLCDTGWSGDALSYNQDSAEYEGIKVSVLWSDEPPRVDLMGAMTSRFTEGMLWLITATPVKCAEFLELIKDMEDGVTINGKLIRTSVKRLTATAWENSITKGKANHTNTKRGLRSDEEIASKIARCPLDERPARIYGQAETRSGKIYPHFNRDVHVKFFDLTDPAVKNWNVFMVMDPHRKYYPFMQWWAYTPDEMWICYNEWPTFDTFGAFYDEIRRQLVCPYDEEQLAQIMKTFDGSQFGLQVAERYIDPWYASATKGEGGRETESIVTKYIPYQIDFTLPKHELIEVHRATINELLKYDPQIPLCSANQPSLYYMPHCRNSIRMIERHSWDEEKEMESERYKEGSDCPRILFAGWGDRGYRPPVTRRSTALSEPVSESADYVQAMPGISIG